MLPGRARILIADDHLLTRAGVRAILSDAPEFDVVGEAVNGAEAVELTRVLQPDLVLMDLRLPDIDGIEATRRIKRVSPGTTVVMLTMFDNPELLAEAISAGAAGVLLKAASETALRAAILDAVDGNGGVEAPRAEAPAQTGLSAREQQVLDLVARGYTNRQIAVRLVITASTVKVHVEHILSKLGVADRTQAAVHALTRGYLTPGYGRSPSPRASRTPAGNRGAY